ncbi:MAG: stage III sporulation protein AA [Clostridiales bacterium]|nr:stage III sporulation protein AA [Clostridiales bacterium]
MRSKWSCIAARADELQEIRLRIGREVIAILQNKEWYLTENGQVTESKENTYHISERDMEAILNHICEYSVYAFADEIKQGFLTIPGGHRIGLAGQVILQENNKIRNMKHIGYMNIRISHEIKGVADAILPYIYENGKLLDSLLISPPGCGKTTLLRDMIRQISDGNSYAQGMDVGVVDERSEIAGSYMGKPQNDVGMRTDILDACPKVLGMMMLIRSMAPKVVAVDELGCEEDAKAICQVMQCGSKIIATIHGDSLTDVMNKSFLHNLIENKIFGRYILLGKINGKCSIKAIYNRSFEICYDL